MGVRPCCTFVTPLYMWRPSIPIALDTFYYCPSIVCSTGSECTPSGGDQQDQGGQVLQCGQRWGIQDNYEPGRHSFINQMILKQLQASYYRLQLHSTHHLPLPGVWLWCDHPGLQHKSWALDCTILFCQGIWVSMELVDQAKPFSCSASSWGSGIGHYAPPSREMV